MTAVAVKVTGVLSQTAPAGEAAMVILAGINGFTSMVTAFETAGDPVAQSAVEFITTVTI